jgi:hypothetical protein
MQDMRCCKSIAVPVLAECGSKAQSSCGCRAAGHCPLPAAQVGGNLDPRLPSCCLIRCAVLVCCAPLFPSHRLKTQASLVYPPERLGAACVYLAYVIMGMEPQTPDSTNFCEFARLPAHTLQGEADMPRRTWYGQSVFKDACSAACTW